MMRLNRCKAFMSAESWLVFGAISVSTASASLQEKRDPRRPAFNQDATKIVFEQHVTQGKEVLPSQVELWIMDANGANPKRLTQGNKDQSPRFGPNGNQIVFTRGFDIWLINSDGSGLRQLTKTSAGEDHPEFSSDGSGIGFVRRTTEVVPNLAIPASKEAIIWHDLADGKEKTLLGDGYGAGELMPNPIDGKSFFILCYRVDPNDPPGLQFTSSKVIAILKPDGSRPRTVYAPDASDKVRIQLARISRTRNVVEIARGGNPTEVAILESGKFDQIPVSFLGDISRDGSLVVGTAIVDDRFNFGIVVYNVEQKKLIKIPVASSLPAETRTHDPPNPNPLPHASRFNLRLLPRCSPEHSTWQGDRAGSGGRYARGHFRV